MTFAICLNVITATLSPKFSRKLAEFNKTQRGAQRPPERKVMESKLNNDYDALVSALTLAITAPTKEKAQECAGMAEFFAESLTEEEVITAKLEATIRLGINQA